MKTNKISFVTSQTTTFSDLSEKSVVAIGDSFENLKILRL